MTKKEIADRHEYLNALKSSLSLEDNQSILIEMTARAKQIEGIVKSLSSANINRDNIPGIDIYLNINKSLVVKKYLSDLFFFDRLYLSTNESDKVLVAYGNIQKFASGTKLLVKDESTYTEFKSEFTKVHKFIDSALSYYNVNDIELIVEHDKPISKIWIRLLPSDKYLEYLKRIKFIPIKHGKK